MCTSKPFPYADWIRFLCYTLSISAAQTHATQIQKSTSRPAPQIPGSSGRYIFQAGFLLYRRVHVFPQEHQKASNGHVLSRLSISIHRDDFERLLRGTDLPDMPLRIHDLVEAFLILPRIQVFMPLFEHEV